MVNSGPFDGIGRQSEGSVSDRVDWLEERGIGKARSTIACATG